eukprot:117676_1
MTSMYSFRVDNEDVKPDETISCILALIVYPIAIWISWLIFKRQHCSKKDPKPLIIISTCIASLLFFFLTEIYWICKYASKLSFIFWFLSKSLLKMYQVDIIKHWYSQSNKILNHIFNTLYVLSIILSIFIIISIWFMYDILTLGYKGCELIQNTHSMLWINDKNYVYLSLYYSITFIIFIIIISKSKENEYTFSIKTTTRKLNDDEKQIEMKEEKRQPEKLFADENHKIILVCGKTGTGKTTLINSMIN